MIKNIVTDFGFNFIKNNIMNKLFLIILVSLLFTSCSVNDKVSNNSNTSDTTSIVVNNDNVNSIDEDVISNNNEGTLLVKTINKKVEKKNTINELNKEMIKYWISLFNDGKTNKWFSWDSDICKKNPDLYICTLLEKNYFYDKFYLSCVWINDINKCDSLKWEELTNCKSDFYMKKIIDTKDQNVCNNFWKDYKLWYLMWSKKYNNNVFCNKFYNNLLKKDILTDDDIYLFINDIYDNKINDKTLFVSIKSVLVPNWKTDVNFIDSLKNDNRRWKLSCDDLKNDNYILTKMKWFKYLFESKWSVLDSYENLWIDK